MSITLYPAIDLLAGKIVRLAKGERADSKIYSDDPRLTASMMRFDGAQVLHVVDLDAAFDGPAKRQVAAINAILDGAKQIPVQLGGGLRDLSIISEAFESGVSRVILGTAAVEKRDVLRGAIEKFTAIRVAVSIDEADGYVKTHGWVEGGTRLRATDLARELVKDGVRVFLHSAIARDGTLEGPDLKALREIAEAVQGEGAEVICAGGVGTLQHLKDLRAAAIPGVSGVVTGRALYERNFTIQQARRILEDGL